MQVILDFDNYICTVVKEKNDPLFHNSGWTFAESTFLYHVLQELKKMGYDVIKKRMWKDGHMVDDTQQYIRTRKWTKNNSKEEFCIYNCAYDIFDAGEQFNADGIIKLAMYWR